MRFSSERQPLTLPQQAANLEGDLFQVPAVKAARVLMLLVVRRAACARDTKAMMSSLTTRPQLRPPLANRVANVKRRGKNARTGAYRRTNIASNELLGWCSGVCQSTKQVNKLKFHSACYDHASTVFSRSSPKSAV